MEFDEKPIDLLNFNQSDRMLRDTHTISIDEFVCDICKWTFNSKSLIERHFEEVHEFTRIKDGESKLKRNVNNSFANQISVESKKYDESKAQYGCSECNIG